MNNLTKARATQGLLQRHLNPGQGQYSEYFQWVMWYMSDPYQVVAKLREVFWK